MSADIEFIQQRLALVQQELSQPSGHLCRGEDRGQAHQSDVSWRTIAYQREARLLHKLRIRARPGGVISLLRTWRQQMGQFALEYRNRNKEITRAHDEWAEAPFHVRTRIPEPPKPPAPRYVDCEGNRWIVDDAFVALLDDLIQRLGKWLDEDSGN